MTPRKLSNPTTWGPEVRKTLLFASLLAIGVYGAVTHQEVLGVITGLVGVLQVMVD